jgi:hypothetical protein
LQIINDYGVVLVNNVVMIGHGMSSVMEDLSDPHPALSLVIYMYSKGGGKNRKHESVSESSNISALSNIGVQVFEHMR